MKLLPTIIGAAAKGNFVPLATLKAGVARSGISAFELLSDCQTSATPARLRALTAEAKTALLGAATLDFPDACPGWGVKDLDATYRAPVRSKLPVLIVSGTLDGRTPLRNAAEVKAVLPNATQIIIDGASHGDDLFLSTPELENSITAFLRGDKVPNKRLTLQSL
jgi:pimeloyl-ACP methyl ester carboxylesterase